MAQEELEEPIPLTRADGRAQARRVRPAPGPRYTGALPDPLDDPLRGLRTLYLWLTVLGLIVGLTGIGYLATTGVSPVLLGVAIVGAVSVVGFTASVWRILPARETDVLYLRSFRYDRATARIRGDLCRAFGSGVRVSGIRDPRQRWPKWLRYPLMVAFALRYSTPKYMNLEAGDAWKERLWRSLGRARGAVIDVTDLTPYVLAELRLCERCLGLNRILFVGDQSRTASEWRDAILRALDAPARPDDVRVAVWGPDPGARREFRRRATRFAGELPADIAGRRNGTEELVRLSWELHGVPEERASRLWLELLLGFAISFGVLQTAGALERATAGGTGIGIALLVGAAFWLIQAWCFLLYLKDCASARERVTASVTLGVTTALPVLSVLSVIPGAQKAHEAAARLDSFNDLRQIGFAFQDFAAEHDGLPSANGPAERQLGPAVSWRFQLLPYLSPKDPQDLQNVRDILKGYRRSEPWDSPHNLQFVEKMPKVFRHPMAGTETPPGHTHYRVFVSPRNAGAAAAFRDGQPGPRFASITDGLSNTILVVEAAQPVPWTKPEGLEYDSGKPLPKLGGHFAGGFQVVFADGSLRFFQDSMPEPTLRAHITANGGETVRGD